MNGTEPRHPNQRIKANRFLKRPRPNLDLVLDQYRPRLEPRPRTEPRYKPGFILYT